MTTVTVPLPDDLFSTVRLTPTKWLMRCAWPSQSAGTDKA